MNLFNKLAAWCGWSNRECPTAMYATVSITIPLLPTPDDLRRAREVLALLNSFGAGAEAAAANTTDADDVADPNAPTHDSTGLPWDARIHSGNRKLNTDGSWKKRRGVQDAEVTRVEAELRAAPPPAVPPPPASINGPQVVPPPPATPPAPPPPAAASEPTNFVELLTKHVTPALQSQKLTMDEINANVAVPLGIPNFAALAPRPDLIASAYQLLTVLLATKG